jgi:deoxyribonuclease V
MGRVWENLLYFKSRELKMILAVDVDYRGDKAVAAGVVFEKWSDKESIREIVVSVPEVKEYIPGRFYQRELPCIKALLKELDTEIECIIVDGYVYLGSDDTPGLGAHLFNALEGSVTVIGVAKKPFKDTPKSAELLRGKSKRPLYITAQGVDVAVAKQYIAKMHGKNRIPTLLKRVDQLCTKRNPNVAKAQNAVSPRRPRVTL